MKSPMKRLRTLSLLEEQAETKNNDSEKSAKKNTEENEESEGEEEVESARKEMRMKLMLVLPKSCRGMPSPRLVSYKVTKS